MDEERYPHRGLITVFTMAAMLMQVIDTSIANITLPYVQGELSASQDEANWVLTSYIVAAAIFLAPTGWLAGRFGKKRVLLFSVAGFVVSSALCGTSTSIEELVVFRIMQGVFGAPMGPLAQTVLLDIYPRRLQGIAMSLWSGGTMLGPMIGPTLGGYLTEEYSWRWVYYINVPFGLLSLVGLAFFLSEPPRERATRLDWFGFLSLAIAIGAFQLGLDRGEQRDWLASPEIVIELFVAAIAFYAFVTHSFTTKEPFIPPALFKDRNFISGTLLSALMTCITFGSMALTTPFMQQVMGVPILKVGIVNATRGLGPIIMTPIVGWLLSFGHARAMILTGFLGIAFVQYTFSTTTDDISLEYLGLIGAFQGAVMGSAFVALTSISFSTLPAELRTAASSIGGLIRNIGGSIGITAMIAFLQHDSQVNHATISAHVTPFSRMLQQGAAERLWNPNHTGGATTLDGLIQHQAILIAYLNDFHRTMLLALCGVPLLLLLRPVPRVGRTATPVAAE